MQIIERLKKGINAYVKNDAKAAAIATVLTNKDCTSIELMKMSGFDKASLGLLPILSNDNLWDAREPIKSAVLKLLSQNSSGRIFFLVCGPSAVGKDTLASYARQNLYFERIDSSYVKKYTTRSRRGFEGLSLSGSPSEPSGNYEYFKDKEEMKREKEDIALEYSIYDNHYGLSGSHLASNEPNDKHLICIYGRFENIHDIRDRAFFKYKRIPFSILITAPSDDLEGRILRRHSISESEQGKRIKEMKRQFNFIDRNQALIASGFDVVIENGDSKSVAQGYSKLTEFLRNSIDSVDRSLVSGS